ncbi:hypothetical protein DYBT9275_05854 [Dyadobacter sp. CECT 9275]|uniref:Uncharacterized protein n=1 Tax=Dyadobacter helix TaxID=2822344 RepID=A0A916N7P2_9BACT|nr:hypothetical protein DYBT9275_05854 [Dyadobacter sp. CECT 9275]
MGDNFFRIYAKMAFNFTAYLYGDLLAKNSCFDDIRNWIINGGENKFSNIIHGDIFNSLNIQRPADSHLFLITQNGSELYAICSLYETINVGILLSKTMQVETCGDDGLICNWRDRSEVRLSEFMNTHRS